MTQSASADAPGDAPALVAVRGLRKVFGGTVALDDVSLDLRPGTIHALLGQNGAGKSTLIKILAGVYTATAGEVSVAGYPFPSANAASLMTFIHQDLGLVEWMTIAENVALGTGYARTGGLINWRQVQAAGREALEICADHLDPNTQVSTLSRADRSLVAIARALARRAKVIVLDEPTASLPAHDSERLFEVLFTLRDRGHGILYVSHRLDEVFRIADHVTVLRDGQVVADGRLADYTPAEMVQHIVGHKPIEYRAAAVGHEDVRLDLKGVVVGDGEPVDLSVRSGEVLAMTGLTGAGHMALGRALAGALPIRAGTITLDGSSYRPRSVADAVAAGVGFVTSNRMEEGCAPELTNRENLVANPSTWGQRSWGWMSPRSERRRTTDLLARFGVRPLDSELPIATLSGGNQQKIMIGRWLSVPRKLLILEEPTAGVDVGAKADLYQLVDDALADGLAILLISTDFEEVAAVCRRALVFVQGRVTAELHDSSLTIASLTAAASAAASAAEEAPHP